METELRVTEAELQEVGSELKDEFGLECPQIIKDIANFKISQIFGLILMVRGIAAPETATNIVAIAFANGVLAGLKLGRKQATAELTESLISMKEDHRDDRTKQQPKQTDDSTNPTNSTSGDK